MKISYQKAIALNGGRFNQEPYLLDSLFKPADYDWPGDYEGRALLAFCCHYEISGTRIPQMDGMLEAWEKKVNSQGYFGKIVNPALLDEQQLAGNSWCLRGLVEHYRAFHDERSFSFAKKIVENLYLPALPRYASYPAKRKEKTTGGAAGNLADQEEGWLLSSDIGCAFIALDGLCHYEQLAQDPRLWPLLEQAIASFMALDKVGLRMQTHATLTALRGILAFYETTKETKYLEDVQKTYDLYLQAGMSENYENYNWFGRKEEELWTEPCAVVDSFILAIELYKISKEERYLHLARRILFNGLTFELRDNGGAGPDSCVDGKRPFLKTSIYEAHWCCSMRYAEGLLYVKENQDLFASEEGVPHKEGDRYFLGDHLLVEDCGGYFKTKKHFAVDGKSLILIPDLSCIPEKDSSLVQLRVVF